MHDFYLLLIDLQTWINKAMKSLEFIWLPLFSACSAISGWLGTILFLGVPSPARIAGGILLSGFLGFNISMILLGLAADPHLSAGVGAIVGASGDRGLEAIYTVLKRKFNIKETPKDAN